MLLTLALAAAFAIFVGGAESPEHPHSGNGTDCAPKAGHVYSRCLLSCPGRAMILNSKEPCYLPSKNSTNGAPIALVRAGNESVQGVCVYGKCIENSTSPQEHKPVS
uniref:Putative secreted protein n=1 Tax=Amblyomma americanum TaxID=6943 RepID=A0A0C9R430_AMBAM